MSEPTTPDKILRTGLAFSPSKTLLSAIELGVFASSRVEPLVGPESMVVGMK